MPEAHAIAELPETAVRTAPAPRWVNVSMVLLPSLYFFLIFRPALIGGKMYGNLPDQEKLALDPGNYDSGITTDTPLFTREPEMIHPDYHLLYEPAAKEIQNAFREGRLPLYNPHRLLGTALWGSPVADPANPLSLLLLFFSTGAVHLIKLYIYSLLAFAGVYWCATSILGARPVPALVGASLYLLNPFMYYMYHWAQIYGVMALAPVILYVLHRYLIRPRFFDLVWIEALVAWVLLINQLQALLYFVLFLFLWMLLAFPLRVYDWRTAWRRLSLVLIGAAGGCALSWGQTRYLLERGLDLARSAHSPADLAMQWPRLLDLSRLPHMWQFAAAIIGHYDAAVVYFPVTVIGLLIASAAVRGSWTNRCRVMLIAALAIVGFHCFVRPLHAPLYWIHLPLYSLSWEQWRVVYIFYLCLGLAVAVAMTLLLEESPSRASSSLWTNVSRWLKIVCGTVCLAAAMDYGSMTIFPVLATGVRGSQLAAACAGFAVLGVGLLRRFSQGHAIALGTAIVAGALSLPMTRIPFYDPPAQPASIPSGASTELAPRVIHLRDISSIRNPPPELLWYNDASMVMFSRNGLTGYDTALQKNEAQLFSLFYSPALQTMRQSSPFLKYGVQSSIVWPDAQGTLSEGKLGAINAARLRVLGVGHILWSDQIDGLPQARWDPQFSAWDHDLVPASTINLLPDIEPEDIVALFSDHASEETAQRIQARLQPAPVHIEDSGSYRAELPAKSGLVVVALNIGQFYRAYLNDAAIPFYAGHNLPFLLARKSSTQASVFTLRPDTGGIWRTTATGIAIGLGLLAFLGRLSKKASA